ncbi:MAG: class I fructose-bisphosphate aldolase [Candidatus Magasanikbacteria bacterium]|jgi:fructose-bisphosphate aldolase, class I|nr:class I fructose-bisphosphate aldolase [Candidatus Magasanikbacteria bacterium]MBT5263139.1 class I fructose-bisphosphate aldolase [Candidatus Magasanikbacteria bacterium]MBT5820193.1 class I fructose-bisphosphate aldolase [Candidatus Magasanikbacteria bacterium]MBT6294076.1 class I fructose-bisphosphate aldolase [Candidatus Magasanikbacteria bacterium]
MSFSNIQKVLGSESEGLLGFSAPKIAKDRLHVPSPDLIDSVFSISDRSEKVITSLKSLRDSGRLSGTGYYSILPVDQGIEHSAGASFAKNPDYFDPENIINLAIEAGCNGVATTYGVLAMMSKKYADKIPFIAKINHNDLLRCPNSHDQRMFASVDQAYNLGAKGVGLTIYFGSEESKRQIEEASAAFARAHELGMFTILWCYIRNAHFKTEEGDFHSAADLTGQANHLGATIGADIVKQKLPTNNRGYEAVNKMEKFGKYDERMYTELCSDHPIDLCRYQVANGYMGRIGLINSGGGSGENDMADAVKTAVINKRAGGSGLILGRKAFNKPLAEGVEIINAVQDVYLCDEVTVA